MAQSHEGVKWSRRDRVGVWTLTILVGGGVIVAIIVAIVVNSQWWRDREYRRIIAEGDAESAALHQRVIAADSKRLAQQVAAAEAARLQDSKLQNEAAAQQSAQAREHDRNMALLRSQTEAARQAAVRLECQGECNHSRLMDIVQAGADEAERRRLTRLVTLEETRVERTRLAEAAKMARDAREAFADAYETRLLDRHMNPDGVSASGTTLVVRGWFCSRQYMWDLQKSGLDDQAKALGFTRIECSSGVQSSWLNL